MLSDLSSIVLREIILRFNEYESIINFKLINKRFFKFIKDDIVIKRYYLKLRYNLRINDEDLFEYIKLLNSKCYSKFIYQHTFDLSKHCAFVNPKNDTFITWKVYQGVHCFGNFIIRCSKSLEEKLVSLFQNSTEENIQNNLFLQGYITLNSEVFELIQYGPKYGDYMSLSRDSFSVQNFPQIKEILVEAVSRNFDENILSDLKTKF